VTTADRASHRSFLNKYYGLSRPIYDLTRKYYLFGRDKVIEQLANEDWTRLVEIGPGTGRNLRKLRELRPDALLGGVEASDAMLEHAQQKCPWARLQQGFAEETDYSQLLGDRPERVLFSYALSMFQEPVPAIAAARKMLAPGGELVIVDFSDLEGLPSSAAAGLRKWLRTFHVEPVRDELLAPFDPRLQHGPGRYYVIARISAET
jgi:S-adenosylmethionine-diacylgycerolhomoserine-N-methlytransferase